MKEHVASTGWIGLCDSGVSTQEEAAGVQEQGWEPLHTLPDFSDHHARPIVDRNKKVIGVHAGHPDDPNWKENVHDPAVTAIEEAAAKASLSESRWYHRRGIFPSLSKGDSHGGGQEHPGAFVNGIINTAILISLCSNLAFIRLAGFAMGVFANWAPNVYDYYVLHMRRFYSQCPHLCRPFLNGIWSACTGSLTKLILEFPLGTTILIPSAAIFHSNIPIGKHQTRYSFTQYTAGGLFQWVTHGFQLEEAYLASLSAEELQREKEERLERWKQGAGLFSTLAELCSKSET
ncbi:hypothetical protein C8J57DRAFT_1435475 [Mycena rebaudengoi]|nr:hypothetical protein C8J57DRAFT_1435475 [Mycena rebaudengoi]